MAIPPRLCPPTKRHRWLPWKIRNFRASTLFRTPFSPIAVRYTWYIFRGRSGTCSGEGWMPACYLLTITSGSCSVQLLYISLLLYTWIFSFCIYFRSTTKKWFNWSILSEKEVYAQIKWKHTPHDPRDWSNRHRILFLRDNGRGITEYGYMMHGFQLFLVLFFS